MELFKRFWKEATEYVRPESAQVERTLPPRDALVFPDYPIIPQRDSKHLDLLLAMMEYMLEAHASQSRYYTPFKKVEWAEMYTDPRNKALTPEERREKRIAMLDDPGQWSPEVIQFAMNFWGHRCAVCKRKATSLDKDHLVPLVDKHTPGTVPSNLLVLCSACNRGKGAEDLCSWYEKTFDDGDPRTESRKLVQLIKKIHTYQGLCWQRGWE